MNIYRKGTELDFKEYNVLCHMGGLGDLIASLPAIKYILDNHKYVILNLFVHAYAIELCEKVFKDYNNIRISKSTDYKNVVDISLPCRSPYLHSLTIMSVHLTDFAFHSIVGTIPLDEHKSYIQLEPINIKHLDLPAKYATLTTGYTSKVREWNAKSINEVSDYLINKGITPVYIGKSITPAANNVFITGKFEADYSKGINLIDKTTLFETHAIMDGGMVTMGVDNGLLHLNSCGRAKAIWGFTTVRPHHRLPYKNGIMGKDCLVLTPTKEELACTFCQSDMSFAAQGHVFIRCFYDDFKCAELLTSDRWIEKLKEMGI